MCEYCGCQALSVIAELTSEHDTVVAMIAEARTAVTRGESRLAAAAARRIAVALGPHTHVEEYGLFPALSAEYPDHIDTLVGEHRRIEDVLAEAADGPPADPAWPARLTEALHLLREHILKEQDGVFPAALISLGADDWERIEQVRTEGSPARAG